jgi:hypothetical protein
MKALAATVANHAWWLANLPAYLRFQSALHHPHAAQARILRTYLRENSRTAFGRDHQFENISSIGLFQRCVPIRSYDELAPYIDRVAEGEQNVLSHDRVIRLATSSGSTRARKLIPYTRSLQREFNRAIGPWIVDLFRGDPKLARGSAYWSITPVAAPAARASKGPPIGFAEDSAYLGGLVQSLVDAAMAVPAQVRHTTNIDEFRRQTIQHLLERRDLRLISVWHPTFLELLLDSAGIDDPTRVWPKLRLISCWADANATGAADALTRRFPGVTIQPKGLLATEAFVTIPFAQQWPLAIRSHFFEFIDDAGDVRLAHELRVDHEYSVVVTTAGGLWRYRLGDRVRVESFVGATPSLRFIGREDNVVDHFGEKLSEGFVAHVLGKLFATTKPLPTFSMLAPDARHDAPGYTLFTSSIPQIHETNGLDIRLDALLRTNPHYDYCRQLGQLHAARVFLISEPAYTKYIGALTQRGQRLGDIKPAALSEHDGWSNIFAGRYLLNDSSENSNSPLANARSWH